MKDLDEFLPNILPYAPGCAYPTALFGIRQAATEFCERTKLWRVEDEFTVTGEDAILAPFGAVVHEIDAAFYNGILLKRRSPAQLDVDEPAWRAGGVTGNPQTITQTAPNELTLVPKATSGTLKLWLWLKPAQDCDELPDFLVDQYRETIAHGALARILVIPNQTFTNPDLATAFAAMFQNKLDRLAFTGTTGQQRAPLRSRAMNF